MENSNDKILDVDKIDGKFPAQALGRAKVMETHLYFWWECHLA